ncbi:ethylbenzene dehydrogenase-related protein [Nitrospira moscoviensis]|uniref:Putative Nitrite oxidoreductase, membrane subunit n=1 Tax=Nitrospira moscoviensis TaxID=42253 RepID=A0A0K2GHZ1_NITMO|nr:ethylbenzene dehydrogenase-related protein [Nitrospira moscoviensis]ALA60588.1 putative Nitrite oxidoreductase, membrane subunit [Nitrospira moscoviensis]
MLALALVMAAGLTWIGIPAVSSQGLFVRSHKVDGPVPATPDDPTWDRITPLTLPLSGQVITRPAWPQPSVSAIAVRSVHNGKQIAFHLTWEDRTKNDRITPGTFRDSVALGLALGDAPAFFCMGQLDHYVNIWQWKADWQTDIDLRAARDHSPDQLGGVRRFETIPRRVSSVEALLGGGFSTLTPTQYQGRVQGKALWKDGRWHVVMTRTLTTVDQENEAPLGPGRAQALVLAVWDGGIQERNGQKAVSSWLQLVLDPLPSL